MNWSEAISKFKIYLKIERGLSENSIESYSSDLKSLYSFIKKNNLSDDLKKINSDVIKKFIYEQSKINNPKTIGLPPPDFPPGINLFILF